MDTSLFVSLLQDELELSGYKVFKKDIFGEMPPNPPETFHILICNVIRISCDTFVLRRESYSESYIKLEWMLLNKDRSEILYKNITSGAARTGTRVGEWSVEESFRYAVRNLLADKSFVCLVHRDK